MAAAPELLDRFLKGNLGAVVARPWFDTVTLPVVTDWYLPLSRAWAVAEAVGMDTAAFREEFGGYPVPDVVLAPVLQSVARRSGAYREAADAWEASLFGTGDPPMSPPVAEAERQDAAYALMSTRGLFLPFHLARRFPALRFEIPAPEAVFATLASALADPVGAFALPSALPRVERSRAIETDESRQYWIRFASPGKAAADTAWARVREPLDAHDCPSVIFAHGIFMEGEFWKDVSDAVLGLVAEGVRVIQPHAPWHGRRRPRGEYGGERIVARTPLGMHGLQESLAREIGVYTAWARTAGSCSVGVGGISLGAITAQLLACMASGWPAESRPDVLLLVATNGSTGDIAFDGALAQRLSLARHLADAGWDRALLERLAPLMEPGERPVIDPARVVVVLGAHDTVTPFAGGLALCDRWGVPPGNRFIRRQGHFSASLGMGQDPAPFLALRDLLRD